MTITFYHVTNRDGLFNLQGRAFFAQETIETALKTTVPVQVLDVFTEFDFVAKTNELQETIEGLADSIPGFKANSGLTSALGLYCEDLLIEFIRVDNPQPDRGLTTALTELIKQMEDNAESVNASAVTVAVAAGGANTGDPAFVLSTKRGDGLVQEHMIAETAEGVATGSGIAASVRFEGEESVGLIDVDWPKGSGSNSTISGVDPASSLLLNGDMEDETDVTDAPDDWVVSVGTIGTTLKMTDLEVQTVIISGTPTAGHYTLTYQTPDGDNLTTGVIAWNASGSTVEAELRKFIALSNIDVVTTGTSPDFTHTITFTGAGGNRTQLTSTDNMTGGAPVITHATSTGGTVQVFQGGKAVEFDSNGAELTAINQLVTLEPETAYAVSLWAITELQPAAGVVKIELINGIGGAVINDAEGVANQLSFNANDLTTAWQHLNDLVSGEIVFRTPAVVPDVVYFRIGITTPISATSSMWLDSVALTEMTEMYPGGPMLALFGGSVDLNPEDKWTLTVTNDRAGKVQEWYNRNFDMASKGLILPSNSAGAETIPDSVVA